MDIVQKANQVYSRQSSQCESEVGGGGEMILYRIHCILEYSIHCIVVYSIQRILVYIIQCIVVYSIQPTGKLVCVRVKWEVLER